MVVLTRTQKAHVLIHNAAAAAAGIGAGWLGELILTPDIVPLTVLQGTVLLLLASLFQISLRRAAPFVLVALFCSGILGRGASALLFVRLPEHEALINILTAAILTEALGWLAYRFCRTYTREEASLEISLSGDRPVPQVEPSLMTTVVRASRRGPLRVLLASAPTLIAALAAFIVPDARHFVDVRLAAPQQTPGQAQVKTIDHPLVERHKGALRISGAPRGGGPRLVLPVRNDVLAFGLERHVMQHRTPQRVRVTVLGLQAPGPGLASDDKEREIAVDPAWQVSVERASDYWQRVRERLALLIFGLLGSLVMIRLGDRRAVTPGALLRGAERQGRGPDYGGQQGRERR
jgi:hypothetical protein